MSTPEIHSYSQAMKWIADRIDYEKIRPRKSSRHFRLERMTALLEAIDSPQERIPVVHIAGTKGKGTTAAILHSILVASGIKTGLFTSPHLHRFEERMRVEHDLPTEAQVTDLVRELVAQLGVTKSPIVEDGPTYFEIATLLAWMLFDRTEVDLAVLETGLGGRLDCTNTCRPVVTVITSIGLDHTDVLGNTLAEIAAEKAGIIKHQIPCITAAHQPDVLEVIRNFAKVNHSPLIEFHDSYSLRIADALDNNHQVFSLTGPSGHYSELRLPLLGQHQAMNAGLAIAAAEQLAQIHPSIDDDSIRRGVELVRWPIRFEIAASDPTTILDAAHNPDSIAAFARTYRECFGNRPSIVLFGGSQDKDVHAMLNHLVTELPTRLLILSRYSNSHRACDPQNLLAMVTPMLGEHQKAVVAETPRLALKAAYESAREGDILSILGSIFFSAEVRQLLMR